MILSEPFASTPFVKPVLQAGACLGGPLNRHVRDRDSTGPLRAVLGHPTTTHTRHQTRQRPGAVVDSDGSPISTWLSASGTFTCQPASVGEALTHPLMGRLSISVVPTLVVEQAEPGRQMSEPEFACCLGDFSLPHR